MSWCPHCELCAPVGSHWLLPVPVLRWFLLTPLCPTECRARSGWEFMPGITAVAMKQQRGLQQFRWDLSKTCCVSLGHLLSLSGPHSPIYYSNLCSATRDKSCHWDRSCWERGGSETRAGLLPGVQVALIVYGFLSSLIPSLPLHSCGLREALRTGEQPGSHIHSPPADYFSQSHLIAAWLLAAARYIITCNYCPLKLSLGPCLLHCPGPHYWPADFPVRVPTNGKKASEGLD